MSKQLVLDIQQLWQTSGNSDSGMARQQNMNKRHTNSQNNVRLALPFLPGRSVKGLLRRCFQMAEDFGWFDDELSTLKELNGEGTGTKLPNVSLTELLFGANSQDQDITRDDIYAGMLRIGNAELSDAEQAELTRISTPLPSENKHTDNISRYFYRDIASTAVDVNTGAAKQRSLRTQQACIPVTLYATLTRIPANTGLEAIAKLQQLISDEQLFHMLEESLVLFQHVGANSQRGFGRTQASLQDLPAPHHEPHHEPQQPTSNRVAPEQLTGTHGSVWRYHYQLQLQQDVISSDTSATVGLNTSADYLRGYLLLGATAGLWQQQQQTASSANTGLGWSLLYSGKVRFGHAFPQVQSTTTQRSLPLPFGLTRHKQTTADKPLSLFAPYHAHSANSDQPTTALSGSFCVIKASESTPSAIVSPVVTNKVQQLKTAINHSSGYAADGQLFHYQAIEAGQCFQGFIDVDDAVRAEVEPLLQKLAGRLYVGRSRNAEYGAVNLQFITPEPAHCNRQTAANTNAQPPAFIDENHRLSLLCCANLAVLDEHGKATLTPTLHTLFPALQEARFDALASIALLAEYSTLRHERFSSFNRKRNSYDMERDVISQGSVLVYQLPASLSQSTLDAVNDVIHAQLNTGVGIYRELGFGQLQPLPQALKQPALTLGDSLYCMATPAIEPQALTPALTEATEGSPPSRLISHLQQQQSQAQHNSFDPVPKLLATVRSYYRHARAIAAIAPQYSYGPGKTQWSSLYECALNAHSLGQFKEDISLRLNQHEQRQSDNHRDPDWDVLSDYNNADIQSLEKLASLGELVSSLLCDTSTLPRLADVRRLLREAMREAEHWQKGKSLQASTVHTEGK